MIKFNSYSKEIIVNINISLTDLNDLLCYLEYLDDCPSKHDFNKLVIKSFKSELSKIIDGVKRNA